MSGALSGGLKVAVLVLTLVLVLVALDSWCGRYLRRNRHKVLMAIADTEPAYGFGLMRSSGIGAGTLYPVLARLEDEGLAESYWEVLDAGDESRPRRRLYRLTDAGRERARYEVATDA